MSSERFNLVVPQDQMAHVREVSERDVCSVASVLRRYIKRGIEASDQPAPKKEPKGFDFSQVESNRVSYQVPDGMKLLPIVEAEQLETLEDIVNCARTALGNQIAAHQELDSVDDITYAHMSEYFLALKGM